MSALALNTGFYFTQAENVISFDKELTTTAKLVYLALKKHMNRNTKKCHVYVRTIAELISRSARTVQRGLNQLIAKGIIVRTERFDYCGQQKASCFTIVGANADCYRHDEAEQGEGGATKMTPTPDKNDVLINDNNINDNKESLKREADLPSKLLPVEIPKSKKNKESVMKESSTTLKHNANTESEQKNSIKAKDSCISRDKIIPEDSDIPDDSCTPQDAPEIMRSTAEYLLFKTGRKALKPSEITALRELSNRHYPSRVQKEINRICERLLRKGKNLATLTFDYIASALRYQKSLKNKSDKKPKPNPMSITSEDIARTQRNYTAEETLHLKELMRKAGC